MPSSASPELSSPFRLVAYSEDKKPANGEKDEKKKDAKKSADGKKPAVTPEPTPAAPVKRTVPKEFEPPIITPGGPIITPAISAESKEPKPAERKEGPSPRIKDLIRKTLAEMKAIKKIETTFKALEEEMRESRTDKDSTVSLDFQALAKKNGLKLRTTKLLSALEMWDYNIGKSLIGRVPFTDYAYHTLVTYRPTESSEPKTKNYYLFWMVDETKDRIPSLDERGVRAEVVEAWKMVHARKDTEAAAEKLADEASRSGKSLKTFFAGRRDIHVAETAPFSWMTVPTEEPPMLSKVKGVEMPGPEFMQKVFTLKEGEIGVAMNGPQTVAYVIRVVKFDPRIGLLMNWFPTAPPKEYLPICAEDRAKLFQAWEKGFEASAGLEVNLPKEPAKASAPAAPPEEPDTEPIL